jgi:hypothetical protein
MDCFKLGMKTLKAFIALSLLGTTLTAFAKPVKLGFSSAIDKSSVDRLLKDIDKAITKNTERPLEIVLNLGSGGGDINQTIRALNYIRQINTTADIEINTKVGSWSSCESACTILFTSGKKRFAGERASFGFHSPKFQRGDTNGLTVKAIEDRYRKIWLDYVIQVDPVVANEIELKHYLMDEEMSYMSGRDLHTGYVTDLL